VFQFRHDVRKRAKKKGERERKRVKEKLETITVPISMVTAALLTGIAADVVAVAVYFSNFRQRRTLAKRQNAD